MFKKDRCVFIPFLTNTAMFRVSGVDLTFLPLTFLMDENENEMESWLKLLSTLWL